MRANRRGKVASMWASWTRLAVVAQRTIAALLAGIAWSSWGHRSYIKGVDIAQDSIDIFRFKIEME
jgi:hypothetical protein